MRTGSLNVRSGLETQGSFRLVQDLFHEGADTGKTQRGGVGGDAFYETQKCLHHTG